MQVHSHVLYKFSLGFSEDESKSAAKFHWPVDRPHWTQIWQIVEKTEYQL